jgi:hypothetical protein
MNWSRSVKARGVGPKTKNELIAAVQALVQRFPTEAREADPAEEQDDADSVQQGLKSGSDQAAAQAAAVKPEDVMATLEKLGELKAKGILTQEEFDAKKAELLKKLV